MPVHGRALIKSFLVTVYKRSMAKNIANQQGAQSDPKATCDPATKGIVDVEFNIMEKNLKIAWTQSSKSLIPFHGQITLHIIIT